MAVDVNPTLHEAARACLQAREPDEKLRRTEEVCIQWREGLIALGEDPPLHRQIVENPGLPASLRLVPPGQVRRRRLGTRSGLQALVHAVAHIEYNAINLAWDCVLRFHGLPRTYYDDWVRIAGEEANHFRLLDHRLRRLGLGYGDLPAHDGLWEMATKTGHDLVARMALVPRVLEARGLDVTPSMIKRVRKAGDEETASVLETILEEEVGHVAVGSVWFNYACERRGLQPDSTFRDMIETYLSSRPKGPFSLEHRRRAGFSPTELAYLQEAAGRHDAADTQRRQGPRRRGDDQG